MVLNGIVSSVNLAISAMQDMQQSMNADVDTSSLEGARNEITQVTAAIQEMNETLANSTTGTPMPSNESPAPVEVPVHWQTDSLEVFNSTGIDRFRQEAASANQMLMQLSSTQDSIARQVFSTNIFPPESFQNLNSLAVRIDNIRNRMQQIGSNPVNMGTEQANAQLEQLRSQLDQALQEQNELNQAMQDMDVSAANEAYLRLSQTVGNTERYLRDNVDEQGRFNSEVEEGAQQAAQLAEMIKKVADYISVENIKNVLGLSDELTQTMVKLDSMNDGMQTTSQLFDTIHESANRTHTPIMETVDAIAEMNDNAGSAFANNTELIAFMEQANKQFAIGGASAEEQSNAMNLLSQAMATGALRGEELNSILQVAPGIARSIEQNMGWAEGSLASYAEEGAVTADVVKNSLLNMADETNEAFDSIPMTFSQIVTDLQNEAMFAFQPIMQEINKITSSDAFQALVNSVIQGIDAIAQSESLQAFLDQINQIIELLNSSGAFQEFVNGIVVAFDIVFGILTNVLSLMSTVASVIVENWSWISPIIFGVVAALAIYLIIAAIVAVINGVIAISHAIKAAAEMLATDATLAETAAQYGLNAALAACPLTWIILLIIALIAIFYAAVAAVNHFAGTSISATGMICGALAVAAAFIGNQIVMVINFIIDVFCVLWNFIVAFANFFGNVFNDPVGAIARLFFDLVDCVLGLLESLASAIDTIFGSNLAGAVSGWRGSLDGWVDKTFGSGEEIFKKVDGSDYHLDRFDYKEAWDLGYGLGEGLEGMVSDLFKPEEIPEPKQTYQQTPIGGLGGEVGGGVSDGLNNSGAAGNLDDIAGDTGAIKDSMDITQEELKYLRDIAEQEVVNRFTTAEITIEQVNHNNVSSKMDLDRIVSGLTDAVGEAVDSVTEGVHK